MPFEIDQNIQLVSFADDEINEIIMLFYQYLKKTKIINDININELSQLKQYLFETLKQHNKYYLIYCVLQKNTYIDIRNILINCPTIYNQETIQNQISLDLICKNLSMSIYCTYFLSEFYSCCELKGVNNIYEIYEHKQELLKFLQEFIVDKSFLNKDLIINNVQVTEELMKILYNDQYNEKFKAISPNSFNFIHKTISLIFVKINLINNLFNCEIQDANQDNIDNICLNSLYETIDTVLKIRSSDIDTICKYVNILHAIFCRKNEFNKIYQNYNEYFKNQNNLIKFIKDKRALVDDLLKNVSYNNCKKHIIHYCQDYEKKIQDYIKNPNLNTAYQVDFLLNDTNEQNTQQQNYMLNEVQINNDQYMQPNYSNELSNNYYQEVQQQSNNKFIDNQIGFDKQCNNVQNTQPQIYELNNLQTNNNQPIEQQNDNDDQQFDYSYNNVQNENQINNVSNEQQINSNNTQDSILVGSQLNDEQNIQNQNKKTIIDKIYNIYNKNKTLTITSIAVCCGTIITILFTLLFKKISNIRHNVSNDKQTNKIPNNKIENKLNKKINKNKFKHTKKSKKKTSKNLNHKKLNKKTFRNVKKVLPSIK